jgi:hypothetical protein
VHPAGQAELFAGGDLGFDVELGGGIFTDQDGGETGADALGGELADFGLQVGEDQVADFGAVEDACGHLQSLSAPRQRDTAMVAQGWRGPRRVAAVASGTAPGLRLLVREGAEGHCRARGVAAAGVAPSRLRVNKSACATLGWLTITGGHPLFSVSVDRKDG